MRTPKCSKLKAQFKGAFINYFLLDGGQNCRIDVKRHLGRVNSTRYGIIEWLVNEEEFWSLVLKSTDVCRNKHTDQAAGSRRVKKCNPGK